MPLPSKFDTLFGSCVRGRINVPAECIMIGVMATAWIHWHALSGDWPPDVTVSVDEDRREFSSYADALSWACSQADRVETYVHGLGEWVGAPPPDDCRAIEAAIERSHRRFRAEQRAYEEPVEWFVAFLEPEVDDADRLAQAARRLPEIVHAEVLRCEHRGRVEQWLMIRILARSKDDACAAANDALFNLVWPPERRPRGPWMLSVGRHQESGLAEFADDIFR